MQMKLPDFSSPVPFLLFLMILGGYLFVVNAFADNGHPELRAFPDAKKGMERFVIVLPAHKGKEDLFKVEIIPGKVMLTDGVNLMRLGTRVEPRTLMGWGYTYYEITGKDVAMSTMMAPPEDGKQVEAFVSGESLFVRYNSLLPLVIYTPGNYEIRYRVWQAAERMRQAAKQ